jgi:hypothetical protein
VHIPCKKDTPPRIKFKQHLLELHSCPFPITATHTVTRTHFHPLALISLHVQLLLCSSTLLHPLACVGNPSYVFDTLVHSPASHCLHLHTHALPRIDLHSSVITRIPFHSFTLHYGALTPLRSPAFACISFHCLVCMCGPGRSFTLTGTPFLPLTFTFLPSDALSSTLFPPQPLASPCTHWPLLR